MPRTLVARGVAQDLLGLGADLQGDGRHPRLAIYGLIEARLQTADLTILGSLNEGTWPAIAAPDPWLAPRIRAELGLPGLDRDCWAVIGTALDQRLQHRPVGRAIRDHCLAEVPVEAAADISRH